MAGCKHIDLSISYD